jgi:hypothetical protein
VRSIIPDRVRSSYHEAGHAAVAKLVGLTVVEVTLDHCALMLFEPELRKQIRSTVFESGQYIRPDAEYEDLLTGQRFRGSIVYERLMGAVAAAHAGAIAVHRKLRLPSPEAAAGLSEADGLFGVDEMVVVPAHWRGKIYQRGRELAAALVAENWAYIGDVARELRRRGRLTEMPPLPVSRESGDRLEAS